MSTETETEAVRELRAMGDKLRDIGQSCDRSGSGRDGGTFRIAARHCEKRAEQLAQSGR